MAIVLALGRIPQRVQFQLLHRNRVPLATPVLWRAPAVRYHTRSPRPTCICGLRIFAAALRTLQASTPVSFRSGSDQQLRPRRSPAGIIISGRPQERNAPTRRGLCPSVGRHEKLTPGDIKTDPLRKEDGCRPLVGEHLLNQHDGWICRLRYSQETELPTHLQHRLVLAQDLADELPDTALPGDVDETGHQ